MSKLISKKNMQSRASQSAQVSPSLDDRLKHALDLAQSHPVDESHSPHQPRLLTSEPGNEIASNSQIRFAVAPIELIDLNPFNARKIYRPERVNELAASIGANGQEIPGIATMRNGRYILVAGHYRLRAIKLLGLTTMNVMLHEDLTDRELYGHSYRENAEREGQSALDNALAWKDLLSARVYCSETELAEATGLSLPNVNKTLRILRLSESILEIVMENPCNFALSSLYELAMFETAGGGTQALEMAKLLAAGEVGRKEIQEARARLETPRERKRKETSRQYRVQHNGSQIGVFKIWDSGRVVLDAKFDNKNDREILINDLKLRLGISG